MGDASHPYLVGLLGAGVGPSLTPSLHMEEARHHDLTYVYRAIDSGETHLDGAGLQDLLGAVRMLGFDGLNVTFPYKQRVIPLLDDLDPIAARLNAVNTILVKEGRLEGHNTDVTGFALAVEHHLSDVSMDAVVQLGAGGAGAAVADALLMSGVRHLTLVERDVVRAHALADALLGRFPGRTVEFTDANGLEPALSRADGVVNCTPTGMAHHPGTPLAPDLLREGLWVADIVYRPLRTELLRHAADRGCRAMHGGFMAAYQAARTFELITGRTADRGRMLRHLERLVSSGQGDGA